MRKEILINLRAEREIGKLLGGVKIELYALLDLLSKLGKLEQPEAKKLISKSNLYELRINKRGQWRFIYAYVEPNFIIILCAFQKKTQKTPVKFIELAQRRLNLFINSNL
jgi:phage-related protein